MILSKTYSYFTHLHRKLYSFGILKSVSVEKKVLSVGNLSFGGTGKTPFVKYLAEELLSLNKKCAILVRSYKGSADHSTLMDALSAKHPEVWGDEACWYFENVGVPIYSGPQKWESALLAAENKNVDVLIVDDGFQHHKLKKDFNIILVDTLKGIKELKNNARDSVEALSEASAVVLTRSNLSGTKELEDLKKYLNFPKPIFSNQTILVGIKNFNGEKVEIPQVIGLVSGIANPHSFEKIIRKNFPSVKTVSIHFPDHYTYTLRDVEKIERENSFILTTEKDEVKLKTLNHNFSRWGVLKIESSMENPEFFRNFLIGLNL